MSTLSAYLGILELLLTVAYETLTPETVQQKTDAAALASACCS